MIQIGGNGGWTVIEALLNDIRIPRFLKVRQIFERPAAVDVAAEIRSQIRGKACWRP
jgi:hypothetical protein